MFTGRSAAAAATTGGLRGWLSVRHSLGVEAALVLTLYGVYELAHGIQHRLLGDRRRRPTEASNGSTDKPLVQLGRVRIDVVRVPGPSRTDTLIALPASPTSALELARDERERRFLERRIEDL